MKGTLTAEIKALTKSLDLFKEIEESLLASADEGSQTVYRCGGCRWRRRAAGGRAWGITVIQPMLDPQN